MADNYKRPMMTPQQASQNLQDLSIIDLLNRARERKDLTEEQARFLEELQERAANGRPIPKEEMKLVMELGGYEIIKDTETAYSQEQSSVLDERITTAGTRDKLSRMEEQIMHQMESYVRKG